MVALRKQDQAPGVRPSRREHYRERCQGEEGNRYTVIVWRGPGSVQTTYSLEDGTPVQFEDDCIFRLPSGKLISRCED